MTMMAAGIAARQELVARASTMRENGSGEGTVRVVAMYRGCASVAFATRLPAASGYRRQAGRYASERRRKAGTRLRQMPKSESSLLSAGRSVALRTCRCSSDPGTPRGGNGGVRVLRRAERRVLLGSAFLMEGFSYCTSVPRATSPSPHVPNPAFWRTFEATPQGLRGMVGGALPWLAARTAGFRSISPRDGRPAPRRPWTLFRTRARIAT